MIKKSKKKNLKKIVALTMATSIATSSVALANQQFMVDTLFLNVDSITFSHNTTRLANTHESLWSLFSTQFASTMTGDPTNRLLVQAAVPGGGLVAIPFDLEAGVIDFDDAVELTDPTVVQYLNNAVEITANLDPITNELVGFNILNPANVPLIYIVPALTAALEDAGLDTTEISDVLDNIAQPAANIIVLNEILLPHDNTRLDSYVRIQLRDMTVDPGVVTHWFAATQGTLPAGFRAEILSHEIHPTDGTVTIRLTTTTRVANNATIQLTIPHDNLQIVAGTFNLTVMPAAGTATATIAERNVVYVQAGTQQTVIPPTSITINTTYLELGGRFANASTTPVTINNWFTLTRPGITGSMPVNATVTNVNTANNTITVTLGEITLPADALGAHTLNLEIPHADIANSLVNVPSRNALPLARVVDANITYGAGITVDMSDLDIDGESLILTLVGGIAFDPTAQGFTSVTDVPGTYTKNVTSWFTVAPNTGLATLFDNADPLVATATWDAQVSDRLTITFDGTFDKAALTSFLSN